MRAAIYRAFDGPITVEDVRDPVAVADGAVVEVRASGVCRSDVRGWCGHDPDIGLPHVPGHELAGVVVAIGSLVRMFAVGDRVTVPFCGGCGTCEMCASGNSQICDRATQPGFTGWGSFAEFVAIEHADVNLVRLPPDVDFETAALLGCRFITAYRAVVERARLQPDEWLAVHGCGGVGLSAVMIGSSIGARVIAVDIDERALEMARSLGADVTIDATHVAGEATSIGGVADAIRAATNGGAHASLDALGAATTATNSIRCLRKLGRHVQPGLFHETLPPIPMNDVIGRELEILGTHGMAGNRIPALLDMVVAGTLDPARLIGHRIVLDDVPTALGAMRDGVASGISVVTTFR